MEETCVSTLEKISKGDLLRAWPVLHSCFQLVTCQKWVKSVHPIPGAEWKFVSRNLIPICHASCDMKLKTNSTHVGNTATAPIYRKPPATKGITWQINSMIPRQTDFPYTHKLSELQRGSEQTSGILSQTCRKVHWRRLTNTCSCRVDRNSDEGTSHTSEHQNEAVYPWR